MPREYAFDVPLLDVTRTPPPARVSRARPIRYAGPGIGPTPTTPPVMSEADGAAVLELLPRRVRNGYGLLLHMCACQYGLCGACERGRCDRCLTVQLGVKPSPMTHIIDRRGFVVGAIRGVVPSVAVWPVGRPCAYVCPCRCPKTRTIAATPAPVVRAEQLDLFDLAVA